jgi:hypothetical protein
MIVSVTNIVLPSGANCPFCAFLRGAKPYTINQAVAHVHFRVAGMLEEGGTQWGEVPRLSVTEADAMAERLRQVEASLPG